MSDRRYAGSRLPAATGIRATSEKDLCTGPRPARELSWGDRCRHEQKWDATATSAARGNDACEQLELLPLDSQRTRNLLIMAVATAVRAPAARRPTEFWSIWIASPTVMERDAIVRRDRGQTQRSARTRRDDPCRRHMATSQPVTDANATRADAVRDVRTSMRQEPVRSRRWATVPPSSHNGRLRRAGRRRCHSRAAVAGGTGKAVMDQPKPATAKSHPLAVP